MPNGAYARPVPWSHGKTAAISACSHASPATPRTSANARPTWPKMPRRSITTFTGMPWPSPVASARPRRQRPSTAACCRARESSTMRSTAGRKMANAMPACAPHWHWTPGAGSNMRHHESPLHAMPEPMPSITPVSIQRSDIAMARLHRGDPGREQRGPQKPRGQARSQQCATALRRRRTPLRYPTIVATLALFLASMASGQAAPLDEQLPFEVDNARPAVSTRQGSDGLIDSVYSGSFSCTDWSGDLSRSDRAADGTSIRRWSARERNQGSLANVMLADPAATNGLKAFTWDNLNGDQQEMLHRNPDDPAGRGDGRGRERVAYLLGERLNEGDGQDDFRKRQGLIGAIVHASPAIVSTPGYLAHLADAIENPEGRAGYRDYQAFRMALAGNDGRQKRLYIGANDGMLHAIDAETGVSTFAFIPTAAIPGLHRLTSQNFGQDGAPFFVDGTPVVRDVYFNDSLGWRSVLVGTLGRGGRALFALDVTHPDAISLLWEFGDNTPQGDPDLGYSLPRPEIVRLHSGQWAVLQGNGPASAQRRAALLIIDIQSGRLLGKLLPPPTVEAPNGLSSVRAADNDSDGLADYAYAGDLQGNLWRFDLLPTGLPSGETQQDPLAPSALGPVNLADFAIAYQATPLFSARDDQGKRQPITLQPSLIRHPGRLGYLVLLATGRHSAVDGGTDHSQTASVYAIWDRKSKGQRTLASDTGARRDNLLTQHPGSQRTVDWYGENGTAHWGWKLDLPMDAARTGERVIADMTRHGHTLLFSSQGHGPAICSGPRESWLHSIDARSGASALAGPGTDDSGSNPDQQPPPISLGTRGGFALAAEGRVFGNDTDALGGQQMNAASDDSGRRSWLVLPEQYR
ncbi:hypothetical protein DNK08_15870 [Stutzerimonas kirkiae]|nr:hypothetical protein DNK08_15870 [Stutzerimonas kirkiae]